MTLLYRIQTPSTIETVKSGGKKKKFNLFNLLAKIFVGSGILIVANVIWPIVSYELFIAPSLKPQELLSPISASGLEAEKNTDFTLPENWFPKVEYSEKRESKITHYTLSIPGFDIEDAVVEVGGEDLAKSLIHFPGSALPGELGATIIFGHSVLPQFFNPDNYMTIFSLIPTLELGEDIIIRFDGITYTYRVIDKIEVQPDNLSVLNQPYDSEYLRLITCTPPGTYLRRGVITAALID
jgi:sortase A